MKSLAFGALLFCGLAAVLVIVATNGLAMRSTEFAPTVVANIPNLPQKMSAPPPDVRIEAQPIRTAQTQAARPEEKDTTATAPRHRKPKIIVPHATRAQKPTAASPENVHQPKQVVALVPMPARPKFVAEKPKPETRQIKTQNLGFTVERQSVSRDESQDMQNDLQAQREWRERTLERWRAEERAQAANEPTHRERRTGTADRTLDTTPVGGLYKADDDKKQSKKKRHRFLFIRW